MKTYYCIRIVSFVPNQERIVIFNEYFPYSKKLVAIHMNKERVKFNKPIYAGFCVIEMSKWVMFDHVYEYLKPKWVKMLK